MHGNGHGWQFEATSLQPSKLSPIRSRCMVHLRSPHRALCYGPSWNYFRASLSYPQSTVFGHLQRRSMIYLASAKEKERHSMQGAYSCRFIKAPKQPPQRPSDTLFMSISLLDRCLHHKCEKRMGNLGCCENGGLPWVVIDRCNLNDICAYDTQSFQAIKDG